MESAELPNGKAWLASHLVLRMPKEKSRHSASDFRSLSPHHILHDVPGNSLQWWRSGGRLGLPRFTRADHFQLETPAGVVVGVSLMPAIIHSPVPSAPATCRTARPLTLPDARIGHEPAVTLRTRALLLFSHEAEVSGWSVQESGRGSMRTSAAASRATTIPAAAVMAAGRG